MLQNKIQRLEVVNNNWIAKLRRYQHLIGSLGVLFLVSSVRFGNKFTEILPFFS